MQQLIEQFSVGAGGSLQIIVLAIVFFGVLLSIFGLFRIFQPEDPVSRRLGTAAAGKGGGAGLALRSVSERDEGISKFVVPAGEEERNKTREALVRAGFRGEHAVLNYYLVRTVLGLLLPLPILAATIYFAISAGGMSVEVPLLGMNVTSTMLVLTLFIVIGFYGPVLFVRMRTRRRQRLIREAFPYALDMLQVAVEAGMGFDAALARVSEELANAHPVLAEELTIIGLELRAGMQRDQVLRRFAMRTGVDEITSFVTVVQQSLKFGTNMGDALQIYSQEMRNKRMMRAEELANKLPVKMSVVMVLFLLPTMFIVFLTPTAIRMIRVFKDSMDMFN